MGAREEASGVLLNASNLHVGGGVQVAVSVICEWANCGCIPEDLEIWASSEVDANLQAAGCDTSVFGRYRVVNTFGVSLLYSGYALKLRRYRRVFTIFGPLYQIWFRPFSIVGFAQPWIIYPDNLAARQMSLFSRLRARLKFLVQEWFFRRADVLVTELEHVSEALLQRGLPTTIGLEVIHNCLGSIYSQPKHWLPVPGVCKSPTTKIGFVGRNYSHKNTVILPAVKGLLRAVHKLDVEIYVTFTEEEWRSCTEEFRRAVSNVGALSVAQCPTFYSLMDAVIFPSVLECFSATPLETLFMGKPLFASDRRFNRDVCGRYAFYFDPGDPADAARLIADYFLDSERHRDLLVAGREHALRFSSARERAMSYLSLLAPSVSK